jgi:predicted dehydrogenase
MVRRNHAEPLPALPHWDRAGALAALVAAVRHGTEPPASGRDHLGSLALTVAAIRAVTTGHPQVVHAVLPPRSPG